MRVLAMAHAYVPHHNAGAEVTLHAELRHLVARGHQVEVLLSREDTRVHSYEIDGVSVIPYRHDGDPQFRITQHRPDVIVAHLENTPRAAALANMHEIPMVHVVHNDHEFTKYAYMTGPTQLAVFNTEWIKERFESYWDSRRMGSPPSSVIVLPPVDHTPFEKVKPGQMITLINLNEEKGGELFWDLAKRFPQRQFLAVKGAYGEQIVRPYKNVMVLEHMDPQFMPTRVYARTKILLMPSAYESYGRVAIEAAHCGIPTIAHATPGLVEALGPAGQFADRNNIDQWAAEITKLIGSPAIYNSISSKFRHYASTLDPTKALDEFAEAMERTVSRGFAKPAPTGRRRGRR